MLNVNDAERTDRSWTADFHRVWSALSIALLGAQVATLALPLAAAISLGASPLEMGLLAAAGQAPFLLFSLPLGVWVDRAAGLRPFLVSADLGRAMLMALVPMAAYLHVLSIHLLFLIAFAAGALTALFDVAHMAYVPALVPRSELTEANGRIQVSHSVADSTGPGLAGVLIHFVAAPMAVAGTACSFLISALLLGALSGAETKRSRPTQSAGFKAELTEGVRALLGHQLLRPIAVVSAMTSCFLQAASALYVLFAARELGLSAAQIGLVIAAGGLTAIPGGLLAGRIADRIGFGSAVLGGWLIEGGALLLVPLANGSKAIAVLAAAQMIGGFAGAIANVNQWSLRQIVTPDHLQGRVTATHRCLVYGAFPLGSLAGGILASEIGLRPALMVCAIGASITPLGLLATPIRRLHAAPTSSSPRTGALPAS